MITKVSELYFKFCSLIVALETNIYIYIYIYIFTHTHTHAKKKKTKERKKRTYPLTDT